MILVFAHTFNRTWGGACSSGDPCVSRRKCHAYVIHSGVINNKTYPQFYWDLCDIEHVNLYKCSENSNICCYFFSPPVKSLMVDESSVIFGYCCVFNFLPGLNVKWIPSRFLWLFTSIMLKEFKRKLIKFPTHFFVCSERLKTDLGRWASVPQAIFIPYQRFP